MNGSQILIKALMREGVETIFGYPGASIIGLLDMIYKFNEMKKELKM